MATTVSHWADAEQRWSGPVLDPCAEPLDRASVVGRFERELVAQAPRCCPEGMTLVEGVLLEHSPHVQFTQFKVVGRARGKVRCQGCGRELPDFLAYEVYDRDRFYREVDWR